MLCPSLKPAPIFRCHSQTAARGKCVCRTRYQTLGDCSSPPIDYRRLIALLRMFRIKAKCSISWRHGGLCRRATLSITTSLTVQIQTQQLVTLRSLCQSRLSCGVSSLVLRQRRSGASMTKAHEISMGMSSPTVLARTRYCLMPLSRQQQKGMPVRTTNR